MVARRRGKKNAAEWGWRLGGLCLCAFFVLGLVVGLSAPGRAVASRGTDLMRGYGLRVGAVLGLARVVGAPALHTSPSGAVALIERKDGFYALSAEGALRGPVSSNSEGDLSILSGPGTDGVSGDRLVEYAEMVVRAEGAMSVGVSEMNVGGDGSASLYVEHSHTVVTMDLDRWPAELPRAAALVRRWRQKLDSVASLDMTTPGEAVLRLRGPELAALHQQTPPAHLAGGKEPAGR